MIKDEDGNVQHTVSKTEHVSEKHGNKNAIYFSTVDGLDEVFEVQIKTGKRLLISFEAWDKDSDGNKNDHEETWTDLEVPFHRRNVSDGWKISYHTKGLNGEAKFTFKYRISSCDTYFAGLGCNSCAINRYGDDCTTYCKASPGFYTCSSKGEKICEQRRKGEDCAVCQEQFTGENCERCAKNYYSEDTCEVHCIPVPNRYICTDQGQKQCLQNRNGSECEYCISNHYGEDCSKFCQETDNYTCDESGRKICKEHFYPAEKCDINCEPVLSNFTCNQTTGQKICVEGKAGDNCDKCAKDYYPKDTCEVHCPATPNRYICTEQGQRQCLQNRTGSDCEECISHHYGEDCSTFCQQTDSYACDEFGGKICEEHFYPAGKCDINCEPELGNFTCDLITGQKICIEGKAGNDCENCAENYYPNNSCKDYCLTVPNRYICTEQGQKRCLQNRRGHNCEECISHQYGEDCSTFCEERDSYTCDESGRKICKKHFFPAGKCDINCEPVPGNFTCNQTTGQKICASGKVGHNCDVCENRNKVGQSCEKCKQFYFGPDCTIRCEPDLGFYSCSDNGSKICHDITMKVENNCRAEAQEPEDGQKKLNIPVLVGGGGAGLLFILILTAVLLKVRRNRSEDKAEETEKRTDSDDRIQDFQDFEQPGWAQQDEEECSTYMNTKGVEGSAIATNGKRDVVTFTNKERFNKEDVYVEALAVRKVEDFGIYVRAECVKRVDYVCGEASAVGKEEEFGTYMNIGRAKNEAVYVEASVVEGKEGFGTYINRGRAKNESVYVEASVVEGKVGFGTYMNAERAKKEDVYVEASAVEEEGFGTYMNAGRAKKEDAYVQAAVVKGEEDFGIYINTKIAQKELPLVKDQSLEENKILGQT